MQEATRQVALWNQKYQSEHGIFVSVNMSNREFAQFDLEDRVQRCLKNSGLVPSRLWLELTETVLINEPERAEARLAKLKEFGVKLCIDDFGTGYSSLGYLARYPFDVLKIDKSFFLKRTGRTNLAIVRSILDLGRNMGLEVVAEGLETEDTAVQLSDLQCTYGQGYLFAKAVNSEEAEAMIDGRPRLVFIKDKHRA